jgi:hypothetical protein
MARDTCFAGDLFAVTRRADYVNPKILGSLSFAGFAADADMFRRGTVTGLTVDSRFPPGGVVSVGFEIIVLGKLADMAAIAGSVEGVFLCSPVYGILLDIPEVPDSTGDCVKPDLSLNVISQRQNLQAAPIEVGEKIVDVFASQGMNHWIALGFIRPDFPYPSGFPVEFHPVECTPDFDGLILCGKPVLKKVGRKRLHGEPVMGRRP